jgi:pimeloyl-ACP methyl ester carboxylesterase
MPYRERDDALIFFEDSGGNGHPILTTHGVTENGSDWSPPGVSPALARAGYRVVDMDMPGHGRSVRRVASSRSMASPGCDADRVTSDIGALAAQLGFDRFHLLTHATGGMAGSLGSCHDDASRNPHSAPAIRRSRT